MEPQKKMKGRARSIAIDDYETIWDMAENERLAKNDIADAFEVSGPLIGNLIRSMKAAGGPKKFAAQEKKSGGNFYDTVKPKSAAAKKVIAQKRKSGTLRIAKIRKPTTTAPAPKSKTASKAPASQNTAPAKKRGRPAGSKNKATLELNRDKSEKIIEAAPKKRGRPAGSKNKPKAAAPASTPARAQEPASQPAPKKRGRPAGSKNKPIITEEIAATPAYNAVAGARSESLPVELRNLGDRFDKFIALSEIYRAEPEEGTVIAALDALRELRAGLAQQELAMLKFKMADED